MRAGDLLVFRPYTWHAYIDTRRLRLINCLFDSRLPRRFSHLLRSVPGSFDLYHRRARGVQKPIALRCRPAQRTALVQRFESIIAEQTEAAPGWQMGVTIGVLDVLLITAWLWAKRWKPLPVEVSIRTEQAVLTTVSYLEDHYTEAVDLDGLASRVHLSRWYLSRSFNRLMGMSVTDFVHRLRVEEACNRLRRSDQAVGRIAGELGYDELAYFSRCFHKHAGKSPRAYRQASDTRHREDLPPFLIPP